MSETTEPESASAEAAPEIDAALLARVTELRNHLRLSFGQVVMAMLALPRYRHQSIMDLNALVLEPLIRDKIAMAYVPGPDGQSKDLAGMAIWASVSEEVDAHIREQIRAGSFPIKLKAEDWASGDIPWLLDVLASDRKTTGSVLANFKQVVKSGELRIHPIIGRMVDKELLERMVKTANDPADAEAVAKDEAAAEADKG